MLTFHIHFYVLIDAYQYGYDIGENGQFHHQQQGPDAVTYGCYGYVDPDGVLRVTHYVADSNGYRVVEPQQPAAVFARTLNEFEGAWVWFFWYVLFF